VVNRDGAMMAGQRWRCVSAQRAPFQKTPFWKYCVKPLSLSSRSDTRGSKGDRDRTMKREIRGQLTCRKKKAQCEPRRLDPIPRAADDGPINFCSFAGRLTCTHMVGMVIFPNKSQGQPWCVVMGLKCFARLLWLLTTRDWTLFSRLNMNQNYNILSQGSVTPQAYHSHFEAEIAMVRLSCSSRLGKRHPEARIRKPPTSF
jgi:hypothetical protein